MSPHPHTIRLRVYNVGLSDCLLLTVTYNEVLDDGRRERHMLIDFGFRSNAPAGVAAEEIAAAIAEHSGRRLDVIVATDRHQDHIGGFGVESVGDLIGALGPSVVVRPWIDNPEVGTTGALDAESVRFAAAVDAMTGYVTNVAALAAPDSWEQRVAETGISNAVAVDRLERWAQQGRPLYVRAGDEHSLEELPGVTLEVLGPPTLDDVPQLTSHSRTSDQYWMKIFADGEPDEPPPVVPVPAEVSTALEVVAEPDGAAAAEWLVRRLRERSLSQSLDIVEAFGEVLNNTRIILLVTVGDRSMLFTGDAQLENWSFTLNRVKQRAGRALCRKLEQVDVYKVGRHGSRNATPEALAELWAGRRAGTDRQLISLLSTRSEVYPRSGHGRVASPDMLRELRRLGKVYRTDEPGTDRPWFDLIALAFGPPRFKFRRAPGRARSAASSPQQ